MHFNGVYTAIITPMTTSGDVDFEGFRSNIRKQLESHIDGIVVLGSTGEAPTLNADEQTQIIRTTLEESSGAVPIIVGCGTYATATTISNVKRAKSLGASAAMVVTPYYNCPTQEGLCRHFTTIAHQSDLPIMIYNIPKRCGRALEIETLERLLEEPAIVCIKEASGDIDHIQSTITLARRYPRISVLSGDDALTLPLMSLGGNGVVSVLSNLIPKHILALVHAAQKGDFAKALEWHNHLLSLTQAAFIETNPIPIKAMMQLAGFAGGPCRLPLCNLSEANFAHVRNEMEKMHLLVLEEHYATQS